MSVVTSKQGDCAPGVSIVVSMSDLQGMLNDFTAKAEEGFECYEDQQVVSNH